MSTSYLNASRPGPSSATTGTNPFDSPDPTPSFAASSFGEPSQLPSKEEDLSASASIDSGSHSSAGSLAPAAEASWQYLGDLPYRRIPIYSNLKWQTHKGNKERYFHTQDGALDTFPLRDNEEVPSSSTSGSRSYYTYLQNTTTTHVVGCPQGIAALTIPLSQSSVAFSSNFVRLYSNSGQLLQYWECPPPTLINLSLSDVVTMGFVSFPRTSALAIVFRNSFCLIYNLQGELLLKPFPIFQVQKKKTVQLATVYDGGVAVVATDKSAAIVEFKLHSQMESYQPNANVTAQLVTEPPSDQNHDRSTTIAALVTHLPTSEYGGPSSSSYQALAVLSQTSSGHPEVFLSTQDRSVLVVDVATLAVLDTDCRGSLAAPIVAMTFAPNGRFVACYTATKVLTVISTNFETKVLDFDTSEASAQPPLDIQWCGEDSIVLNWKDVGVLMVGPYGDWLRFPYPEGKNLYLIPEIDCCRIITDESVDILQRVPPDIASLMRLGSVETAAMLLDASDAFHSGSPSSEEPVREMIDAGTFQEAVAACAEAATKEFDIPTQKRLLRAASFGINYEFKSSRDETNLTMGGDPLHVMKNTFPSRTTVQFVDAARKVRILNALRHPDVGFLLTSNQFDSLTPIGIVSRLIEMNRPALAASISRYLHLPKAVQLYARASKAAALVSSDNSDRSDTELAEAAIKIIEGANIDLNTAGGSSLHRGGYAVVAKAAIKAGRQGVANLLLMLETSVVDKVPALVSTKNFADAIAVATTAKDADFIFRTLMDFQRECLNENPDVGKAQAAFITAVATKFTPEAFHTVKRYLEIREDHKSLALLLARSQRFGAAGGSLLSRALKEEDSREKQGILSEASRVFGLGKDCGFEKQSTDDFLGLIKDQEVLRTKYGSYDIAPDSTSLTSTINSLIRFAATRSRDENRIFADVEKLGKKYRISEKRFWHIKIKAFAENDQWSHLRSLADSKKSPVGYKPFARVAIHGQQPQSEILRYIDRILIPEEKYDVLCEAGQWKKALDVAAKLRDSRRILNVKTLCNDTTIQLMADEALGRMT